MNVQKFTRYFNKEYDFLYENQDNVAGYRQAVKDFDLFLKSHGDIVAEFNKYRHDIVSSDREAAAFMFALNAME